VTSFWFFAGVLTTLASLIAVLPWLRTIPRLGPLPAIPRQASVAAGLLVAAILGLCGWLGHSDLAGRAATAASPNGAAAANAFANAVSVSDTLPTPVPKSGAGSMDSAIAALQARLAKGGGTAADWELLAKSYEFLGRAGDASKARSRQLPALPSDTNEMPAQFDAPSPASAPAMSADSRGPAVTGSGTAAMRSGTAVSGEVSLAAGLSGKAAPGATLFIIAKSVDSPGPPVAVFRGTVAAWPVKFTLDDSQSMLPGRNLSKAGRVTIEARISQSGQPMPAAGDLQGSSGVFDPAGHQPQPLKILIDRVIT
jgi:hypothetical protein